MHRMPVNPGNGATATDPSISLTASRPDLLTVAAITIVATVVANLIHEGLGHGGMCIATGLQPLALSTVHFECSSDTRLVAAGGTIANLVFGALFWASARAVKQSASWRYFFWLLMTFNLLEAGGYFLFSGIGDFGDWAMVVEGWQPAWAWRIALIVVGTVTYFFLFVPLCVRESRPFLGKDENIRVRRARRFMLASYFTSGVLSCVAGALNPVGHMLILLSAAAASFGGHSALAWMWTLLYGPRIPNSELQMPELERSHGWMIASAILAIVFVAWLGPGVKVQSSLRPPSVRSPDTLVRTSARSLSRVER